MQTLTSAFDYLLELYRGQVPWVIGLSALFSVLALFQSQACNPGRPWWKSRDLLTDVHYFFLSPIVAPYAKVMILVLIAVVLRGAMSEADVIDYLNNGRGPISHLPTWSQVAFYMLGTDFLLYWTHRTFHRTKLWPFHAVHHSSLDVDWTTTYRAHPVNMMFHGSLVSAIMVALGVSPAIMIALVPFDTITAAFVHANLNWTLGPLKYLIATPVFHRWHHTLPAEGGECNFAPTFAVWDWLFGTFYMPEGKSPEQFGVDDPAFPHDWVGQMIVPFRQFFTSLQPARPEAPHGAAEPTAKPGA